MPTEHAQQLVDQMNPPVVEHAAACHRVSPPAEANAPLAVNAGLDGGDISDFSALHGLTGHEIIFIPTAVLMNGKNAACLFGSGNDLFQLIRIHGDGFFAHNVFSGLQAGNGQLGMDVIGRADEDQRNALVRQKILQTVIRGQAFFFRVRTLFSIDVVS